MKTQSVKYKDSATTLTAGAIGAGVGYGLKYALPLSELEKNQIKNDDSLSVIRNAQRNARKKAYKTAAEQIETLKLSPESQDVFIKNRKSILDNDFKLDTFNKTIADELAPIMKKIDDKGRVEKRLSEKMLEAFAVKNRSTLYFMAFGAIVFATVASLGNMLSNHKNQK